MENRTGATGTSVHEAWLALVSHLKRDTAELTGLRGGGAAMGNDSCRKAPQLRGHTGIASWTAQLAKTFCCDMRSTK